MTWIIGKKDIGTAGYNKLLNRFANVRNMEKD